MRSAIRYAVAALAILAALVYFFASAEVEGGVPIWDWLRDPEGSRDRHAAHLAGEDARAAAELGEASGYGGSQVGLLPRWSGRVLRLDGSPVADFAVSAGSPALGRTRTDASGRFTLPAGADAEKVGPEGAAWMLLGAGRTQAGVGKEELVLVVAERTALTGTVIDPTGIPIEGAHVEAFTPLAAAAAAEIPIELPGSLERKTTSDAQGRFVLSDLPRLPFLRIDASKAGFDRVRRPLPDDPSLEVEIALAPIVGPH
jgi:Carboxypeptidase regulatory-like domain